MNLFEKAFAWTVAIGFALMGIYVGLLVLRVSIEVAGFLLGSSLGTIVLLWIMYMLYKHFKDRLFD